MNKELTTKIMDKVFNVKQDHANVNKWLRAVIVNFGDERGYIVVTNDNYGTRRKYADFAGEKRPPDCIRSRSFSQESNWVRYVMIVI